MTGLIPITPQVADQLAAVIKPRLDDLNEIWEREGAAALDRVTATGAKIFTHGGNCPVQIEGEVDGKAFYFRARGQHWQFHVADREGLIFDKPLLFIDRLYNDEPYEAGWMPLHEAMGFVVEGIGIYRAQRSHAWVVPFHGADDEHECKACKCTPEMAEADRLCPGRKNAR
jgi:hypothetical protein